MNFLAHMLLSGPDLDLALGNFLADMIKVSDRAGLPSGVLQGINFHHAIDRFTDFHPQVSQSKARIRPWAEKYAPVVMDVYFDLSLALRWERFARIPFDEFQNEVYRLLDEGIPVIPTHLRNRVDQMIEHRWLETYTTWNGLEEVFHRMRHRASKPELLMRSIGPLKNLNLALDSDLELFWPDLEGHTNQWVPDNPWLLMNETSAFEVE